ncbi:MAG: Crp/Fnr family transcriptional regulator [Pseudomonadales bacterium]
MLARAETVQLTGGETLYDEGDLNRIYFPSSGCIALTMTIDGAASLEVALIGDEGACGFELVLGIDRSTVRAVAQGAGSGLRVNTVSFKRQLAASIPLARMMGRYVHVHLNQLAQLAACTRFHVVEQRLARWLLMTQDRAHADTFHLTHQLLSSILGVRRVGVTRAAGALQDRGLIEYRRGRITVLNRRGLKTASCSCYAADRRSYENAFE